MKCRKCQKLAEAPALGITELEKQSGDFAEPKQEMKRLTKKPARLKGGTGAP